MIHRWDYIDNFDPQYNLWIEYDDVAGMYRDNSKVVWRIPGITLDTLRCMFAHCDYSTRPSPGEKIPFNGPLGDLYKGMTSLSGKLSNRPLGQDMNNLQGNTCNHVWLCYNGFSEQFEFCKTCDIKRGRK